MKKIAWIMIVLLLLSIMTISYFTLMGGSKYNLNTIPYEEGLEKLQSLSQIGEVKAELIMQNRPYKKLEDIMKINGIGSITYENINKYFKVSGVK